MTHILVKGSIFETPRNWLIVKSRFMEGILTCHQCCGFWVGMLVYFGMNGFEYSFDFFWAGCISSGSVILLNGILNFLFSPRS